MLSQLWDVLFRARYAFRHVKTLDGAAVYVPTNARSKKLFEECAGFAIADSIYVPHARVAKSIINHELEHVRQHRNLGGVLFPLLYWISTAQHGYEDNPFEVDARKAERPRPPSRSKKTRPRGRR